MEINENRNKCKCEVCKAEISREERKGIRLDVDDWLDVCEGCYERVHIANS